MGRNHDILVIHLLYRCRHPRRLIGFDRWLSFVSFLPSTPHSRDQNKFGLILKAIGLFLIGAYTGYFGAAGGVIILAILTLSLPQRFAVLNAFKNVMAFMANAVATVIYAWTGKIDWVVVLPLGIGFLIGGYCGPIVVRHVPVRLLRILIAFAAFGLAADLFVQAYF